MGSPALFSTDEINGNAPAPSSQSAPPPSGGLFSPDEITAASGGNSNAPDIGHQPASLKGVLQTLIPGNGGLTAALQGAVSPIVHPLDMIEGIGEGALQTVHGTGELIRKGGNAISSGLGDKIVPQTGQAALQNIATPDNPNQQIGKSAEDIAEFVAGDEALKSMSLGKRALEAANLADRYEKASPFVRKTMEVLFDSARQGTVAAGDTAVKAGDLEDAAKAGVAGAALAPISEAVAPIASKAGSVADDFWQSVAGTQIQKNLKNGLRSVMASVAGDADVDVKFPDNTRDLVKSVADGVEGKSKGLFQQVDDATNGQLTSVQNEIKKVDRALRIETDDSVIERLDAKKAALSSKLEDAFSDAQKAGLDPSVVDDARNSWKQASSLQDLDSAIKQSTLGPVQGRGTGAVKAAEIVDPKRLAPKIEKLWDNGRLQDAVGEKQAGQIYDSVYKSLNSATTRAKIIGATKTAAKYGGAAAGLGGVAHVLGGSKK